MNRMGFVVSAPQIAPLSYQGKSKGLRIAVIVRLIGGVHLPVFLPIGVFVSEGDSVMVREGDEPNTYFAE